MAKPNKEWVVGIDLGTTYSCVAVWLEEHSRVEIIHNDQGNRITPSCVAFTENQRLIGDAAKNQAAINPTNTLFDNIKLCQDNINHKHFVLITQGKLAQQNIPSGNKLTIDFQCLTKETLEFLQIILKYIYFNLLVIIKQICGLSNCRTDVQLLCQGKL
ncbi:hypothetical protein LR48_Vigan549s011700 [Vigna angularis]|uniref:Uncharacterized protein n=1 Tax=Phaseolus angularis TaxID=3914 RepID=A0A0L9TDH3_PHAAN|nr:hypothetical protein LR48_Vigan549s011700 [Vigna angularis]